MRSSQPQTVLNEEGQICVILLEASYCAEQEQGIDDMLNALGIDTRLPLTQNSLPRDYTGPWGLLRRGMNPPKEKKGKWALLKTKATKKTMARTLLTFSASEYFKEEDYESLNTYIKNNRGIASVEANKTQVEKEETGKYPRATTAAWDKEEFCILTRDEKVAEFLETFYNETLKGADATEMPTLWLGGAGNNPFARNGLVVGLVNRIDPEEVEAGIQSEQESIQLEYTAKDTGIYEKISASKYYCLSPGSVLKTRIVNGKEEGNITTKHPVMFYLNPTEQKRNNSGWFTVEELEEWTQGKGPIPKKEEN